MADPKNKWDQPSSAPPPMFFGKKERDLVKQVNDELSERIVGQPIAYYPISIEESNFNETYGEALEKVSLPPVRVYAYVEVANEQTNEVYGYEYQTKLTVYFSEKRIADDQNLYVRVGDFVQYGDFFYEIVRTYDDTRYYFGQVEHKFQIAAECVRARDGAFRVMPAVTRPTERQQTPTDAQSPAPRAAPYPPLAASYVTVTADSKLPNERVLTAGSGITITDGGANSTLTIAATGGGAGGSGIFTTIDGSNAYVTSSLAIGGTTAPDHKVAISGSLSASVNVSASAFYGETITVGTLIGGSPLAISASAINLTGNVNLGSSAVISSSTNISASAFYGDASRLTNLPAGGLVTAINGSSAYLTSSLALGGTTAPDHELSISGSVSASVNVSASAFYGSGTGLTGISADGVDVTSSAANVSYNVVFTEGFQSDGSLGLGGNTGLNFNPSSGLLRSSGAISGAAGLTGSAVKADGLIQGGTITDGTATITGGALSGVTTIAATSLSASSFASASAFYGDGSTLSNLPVGGLLTAINGSSAYLTSSLALGGTSAADHALSLSGSFSASVNVSASAFYGSGTGLTGISADGVDVTSSAANVTYNVVFTEAFQTDGSLGLGGNTGLNFNPSSGLLQAAGAISGAAGLTGSAVKADGLIQGGSVKGATLVSTTTVSGALGVSGSALKADGVVQGGAVVSTGALSASSTLSVGSNASIAGHLTASVGLSGSTVQTTILSSSYFSLLPTSGSMGGPSSYLALDTNNQLIITSSLGSGVAGGLFTAIDASHAYITSSVAFGGTSSPDHRVSISGSLSASVNVSASGFYGDGASLTSLTIGTADDGSYSDGLFTDFTTATPVGTAVDRFNEILKALSPGPAPNLDDIDCNDTGASAELSFGASQGITGYTDVGTAAGFSAVDINGTYSTSTSSNNLRRAVFGGSTVINGDLNEDVSADGVNYPANSFGDANAGNLVLEVNGATLHTASLTDPDVGTGVPGSGTGTDLNGNGSGFYDLSQTGSAEFDDGTELDLFQHRTGKYKVVAADQRDGWNYLRVVHTSSTFDRTTNYVAWVNDSNSSAITASNSALDSLSMTGDLRLSGVKYHRGGTAEYRTDVGNAYRNVYTSTNISYTVTNGTISSTAMPSISVGSENEFKTLQLTGSLTINASSILNGSIAAGVNVAHPIKSNLSNGGSESISGLLVYNRSNSSTTTSETFRREDYRIVSGNLASYGEQADVTDAGNAWNSTSSLLTVDGLLFYNQRLYSPIDGDVPNSGNFSTISNGPGSNVNYSTISGTRTFFRYFTNTGAASQTNFELTFGGDSSTRIVPSSTALSSTNIHVFVKLPTTSTAMETGWLDLGVATANDAAQLSDFDGAYVGTVPGGGLEINSDTHEATLVTQTVEQNENIVIKIVADAAWTGYVSSLSISWGSG